MCGIAGYIGKNNTLKILVNNLKQLEYRGYDSAGVAFIHNNKISCIKQADKVKFLENKINFKIKTSCGIAHTRWATHGTPSVFNSHPHLSFDNKWAVVHNGIIENYEELKNNLKVEICYRSQTDTEIVAHLLACENGKRPIHALINVCKQLKGSYALACINEKHKEELFLARKKSPLYISYSNGEVFVASDILCFNNVNFYYALGDEQFCHATKAGLTFYNINGEKIILKEKKILQKHKLASKEKYEHYMLKEINDVPNVLKNIATSYYKKQYFKPLNKSFINSFNKIYLIGCGTAYHASCMGAKFLSEYSHLPSYAFIASEFNSAKHILNEKTLCIFVSQSGETADTLRACEIAKSKNAFCVALCNVLTSSICSLCDMVLPVLAGCEIAVASTKAYSAQVTILYMLAQHLKNVLTNEKKQYFKDILFLAKNLTINNIVDFNDITNKLISAEKVFFIGRNYDYITCLEASLKLKEITYIFSAEHPAGELKHGFLALIDESCVVFAIATEKELLDKTLTNASEALSRGATVILASQFNIAKEKTDKFLNLIKLPSFKQELMPIAAISYFQIMAYATCIKKGLNPDQPRNLAKSVTVE